MIRRLVKVFFVIFFLSICSCSKKNTISPKVTSSIAADVKANGAKKIEYNKSSLYSYKYAQNKKILEADEETKVSAESIAATSTFFVTYFTLKELPQLMSLLMVAGVMV